MNDEISSASYGTKPSEYFSGARLDYVEALPQSRTATILEIGCGEGATGAAALASGRCARYCGIEFHEVSAMRARERLSEVLIGDVETMPLPWSKESFDILIASEVLEHLVDPWNTLRKLSDYVRPGGLVFASSPNVSHYKIVWSLIMGRWELEQSGPMDVTHLRWFTPSSFRKMFLQAGFAVDHQSSVAPPGRKAKLLGALVGKRFEHLLMRQINLIGHKP